MRTGFSLADVKAMRVADLAAFADVAAEGRGGAPRRATQEDIDRLLA